MKETPIELDRTAAVILVAGKDFGRCPVASNLPRALWPVGEKTVLQRLVEHVAEQGIKKIVICSSQSSAVLSRSVSVPDGVEVKYHQELLARGTAGSLLDASYIAESELLFVFHAEIISPPDIKFMLNEHFQGQSDMTVMLNPALETSSAMTGSAEIYVCEQTVMEYISSEGYCDIKETLVPKLVESEKTIYAAEMERNVGNFRTWRQYLSALGDLLDVGGTELITPNLYRRDSRGDVRVAQSAKVDPTAEIIGPVAICDGAVVGAGAVIFGPAVIGKNVHVGKDSVISESVVWDRARVNAGCFVQKSLVAYDGNARVSNTIKRTVIAGYAGCVENCFAGIGDFAVTVLSNPGRPFGKLKNTVTGSIRYIQQHGSIVKWLVGMSVLAAFIWSYWGNVFADLWTIWVQSDEYSSGMLVPVIAIYVLWSRRKKIMQCKMTPCLWGLVIFMAAQALRFFGLFFMYASAERLSMILTLTSLVVLLFGWRMLAGLSTVLLFLCLMLPLPNSVHTAVTIPLQAWATTSAVFCLEMLGFGVIREGNVINLNGVTVAVAEACNGLRMLTSFFVISGMVALLINRRWWLKLIIVLSSIPIALLCNTMRLTITSIAFTKIDSARWETLFHDFGGIAMMPVALVFVVFELWLLSRIFIEEDANVRQVIYRKRPDCN